MLTRRGTLLGATLTATAGALATTPSLWAQARIGRRSTIPDPIGALITRWRHDPYALGAYSFLARGARLEDRASLAAPVGGTLYFAGEAASRRYPSTVHGALLSGQHAAERLAVSGARFVAIVGAGIAGLRAAQILTERRVRCVVLEARDRIGGRIWTNRDLGLPIDLGASWIHGTRGNPLTGMARRAGAETAETDFERYRLYDAAGQAMGWRQTPPWFQDVVLYEQGFGADLVDLSDAAFDEGEEFRGAEVIFPRGYDQLFPVLEGPYETRLSSPVTEIAYGGTGVTVTVGGETVSADAALVTVPLGVLKAGVITFAPALPAQKQEAIDRLGMGLLNKVVLQFDEVFWDQNAVWIGYVGPARGRFAVWLNLAPFVGAPVLMAFNAGRAADAIEAQPDDAILAEAMSALRAIYGRG